MLFKTSIFCRYNQSYKENFQGTSYSPPRINQKQWFSRGLICGIIACKLGDKIADLFWDRLIEKHEVSILPDLKEGDAAHYKTVETIQKKELCKIIKIDRTKNLAKIQFPTTSQSLSFFLFNRELKTFTISIVPLSALEEVK